MFSTNNFEKLTVHRILNLFKSSLSRYVVFCLTILRIGLLVFGINIHSS